MINQLTVNGDQPALMNALGKPALRSQIRRALKALDARQRVCESLQVCERIVAHPRFRAAESLSIFVSLPWEIETRILFERAFELHKRVYVPFVAGPGDMRFVSCSSLEDLDSFPRGAFGVAQPATESIVARTDAMSLLDLDLIIVPGLAFDTRLHRLGQGGGFYDRFIADARQSFLRASRPPPFLLGVGLSPQLVPCDDAAKSAIPIEANDEQLDAVVCASHASIECMAAR